MGMLCLNKKSDKYRLYARQRFKNTVLYIIIQIVLKLVQNIFENEKKNIILLFSTNAMRGIYDKTLYQTYFE